tara:strand:+ start:160 stop:507 length:348 start_codon:yes stop_codon:yes gene_type:complete
MKVIIAGGRDFDDYDKLKTSCDFTLNNQEYVDIVSGMARGADNLGMKYAVEKEYNIFQYPADWDKYGKSAGYRRNSEMAKDSDALIAFWDGKSRGTKSMIDLAVKNKLKVRVIYY